MGTAGSCMTSDGSKCPLGGTPIAKYSAAPPAMLSGVSRQSNDGVIHQTYMLKQIPISKSLRSEGNATHSSVQEVESPVTFPTLPDGFVPLPRSMYRVRCWRGPPRCHDLLRYLVCRHTELGSLRQVWRKIGRSPRNWRSSEVIRGLRALRAHGWGGLDWISTSVVEGAFRL
jgi:hypothetical protein